MTPVFAWRVEERLGCKAIADRLNTDLDRYPPQAWVWPSVPTHEPLVTKETFIDAQKVATARQGSRNGARANSAHPDTKRTYALRSYMTCACCEHRMRGRYHHETVYYICDPAKGYAPEGHPRALWIRKDLLMDGLTDFFTVNIFGPHRRNRIGTMLTRPRTRRSKSTRPGWTPCARALRRPRTGGAVPSRTWNS